MQTYVVPRTIKVDFEYTVIEENLVQRYKPSFGTKQWLERVQIMNHRYKKTSKIENFIKNNYVYCTRKL